MPSMFACIILASTEAEFADDFKGDDGLAGRLDRDDR